METGLLTQIGAATSGNFLPAALALICLLQYAYYAWRSDSGRSILNRYRNDVSGLENEVASINRDRSLTRIENQVLREILGQSGFDKSLALLLKRFLPDSNEGFAAIVRFESDGLYVQQARGLDPQSRQQLAVDPETEELLRAGKTVVLEGGTLARSRLFASLTPNDRRHAQTLFLVGIGQGSDLFAFLLTSSLIPVGAHRDEQLELARRLMLCVSGNLRQTVAIEKQSNLLRSTREMLELKSIADSYPDQPLKMLERFISRLLQLTGAERGALYMLVKDSPAGPKLLAKSGLSLPVGIEGRWTQLEEMLLHTGFTQTQLLSYTEHDLRRLGIDSLISSAVTCPIRHGQIVTGLLCLTRRNQVPLLPAEVQLVQWAGETLGTTIQRALAFVAIERQARQDGLTELANRRTFDLQLQREMQLVEQGVSVECSLLLCDLDRFKMINDHYGHQAGDEVLRQTAARLKEQLLHMRASDRKLLARYGGEEMAILLPGVGVNGAMRIAETVREAIAKKPFPFGGEHLPITLSIGVATCPLQSTTAAGLIQAADAALYKAKSSGRNCVCSTFDTPVLST